jgi:hypothetical protein
LVPWPRSASSDLVPRRQRDLVPPGRDYLIYARECRVKRIYEVTGSHPPWFWGLQGVFTSTEIGRLQGAAPTFEQTKIELRAVFETWLAWALAIPETHLSYARIRKDLEDVCAV